MKLGSFQSTACTVCTQSNGEKMGSGLRGGGVVLGRDSLVAQVEAGGQSEGLLPVHLAAPTLVRRHSQNNHWHRSISTQGLQDNAHILSCSMFRQG